jgi:hypothetical protein
MFKKLVIVCAVMLMISTLHAQDVSTVDRTTYDLWQQKRWKDLLKNGNNALKQKIDFYYLRVRMGIAAWERKNYHMAAKHFEKALKFNASEDYVKEYLYFSYLYAGRREEARKLSTHFSDSLKLRTGTDKRPVISRINASYSYDFAKPDYTTSSYTKTFPADLNGEQYIERKSNFLNLGMTHDLGSLLTISHSYSFFNQHYFRYRQMNLNPVADDNYQSNIHQYYLMLRFRLARNWYLSAGLTNCWVRHAEQLNTPLHGPRQQRETVLTDYQWVSFLNVQKRFNYVSLDAGVSYASLNSQRLLQVDASLWTYPFGNLNLYTHTVLSYKKNFTLTQRGKPLVLSQMAGGKITRFLWAEVYGTFGNLSNYSSAMGEALFNGINDVKLYTGARLIFPVSNSVNLNLEYAFSQQQSRFVPAQGNAHSINAINFNTHSITGGLQWNFTKKAGY